MKKKPLSLNVYSNQYRFLFSVLDVFIFQVNIITNNASQIAKTCVYANQFITVNEVITNKTWFTIRFIDVVYDFAVHFQVKN